MWQKVVMEFFTLLCISYLCLVYSITGVFCISLYLSQYLPGNPGTGFRIRQCMMMFLQPITTKFRNIVELMIHGMGERTAGSLISAMKFVIGIVHLVATEDGFQTTLVECFIVCHQGKSFYHGGYLRPYLGKHRCIVRVLAGETMYFGIPITIVIRLRLDEGVERIHNLSFADNHDSHTANTGALVVGGFKIDGCKVFNVLLFFGV